MSSFDREAQLPLLVELERTARKTVLDGASPFTAETLAHIDRQPKNRAIPRKTIRRDPLRQLVRRDGRPRDLPGNGTSEYEEARIPCLEEADLEAVRSQRAHHGGPVERLHVQRIEVR